MSAVKNVKLRKIIILAALSALAATSLFFVQGCSQDNIAGTASETSESLTDLALNSNSATTDARPAPECLTDHTADLIFVNESRRTVYRMSVDGEEIGLLLPGSTNRETVSASYHTVLMQFVSGGIALSQGTDPYPCEEVLLRCSRENPGVQEPINGIARE
jgi:hypothetical protein